MLKMLTAILLMTAGLAGCDQTGQPDKTVSAESTTEPEPIIMPPPTTPRWYQLDQVNNGAPLYKEHCASCHGSQGEGDPAWRQRDADGNLQAPPLNGTGHAWHHPLGILYQVIMNGSPGGKGSMPAWKDKLSQDETLSIIAWFQSHWPDEIHAAWYRNDKAARRSNTAPR